MQKQYGRSRLLGLAVAILLMSTAPLASAEIAASLKAGTLGLGAELTTDITRNINLRAGISRYSLDFNSVEASVDYRIDFELDNMSLLADWHLFSGAFRVSAGLMNNGNKLAGTGRPFEGNFYRLGDNSYSADEVGNLEMRVAFDSTAPYVGIGWGNPLGLDARWRVTTDIGVMLQGRPTVAMTADGSMANDADFIADLQREQQLLQAEMDNLRYYPVLAIGVSYRF